MKIIPRELLETLYGDNQQPSLFEYEIIIKKEVLYMTVNDLHKALSGLIAMKKGELEVLIASTEGMDEYYLITNLSIKTIRNAKLEPQEVIIIE